MMLFCKYFLTLVCFLNDVNNRVAIQKLMKESISKRQASEWDILIGTTAMSCSTTPEVKICPISLGF